MSSITSTELKKITDKGLNPAGSVQVAKNGARYVKVSNPETGKIVGTRFLTGANKGNTKSVSNVQKKKKSSKNKKNVREIKSHGDVSQTQNITSSKMREFDSYFKKQNELKKQKTLQMAYNKTNDVAGGGLKDSISSGLSLLKDKIVNSFTEEDSFEGGEGPDEDAAGDTADDAGIGEGATPEGAGEVEDATPTDQGAASQVEGDGAEDANADATGTGNENANNEQEDATDRASSTESSESAGSQNNDEIKNKIIKILEEGNVTTPYCLLLDAANKYKPPASGGGTKKNKMSQFKDLQGHMNMVNRRLGEIILNGGGDAKSFVSSLNSSEKKAFKDLSQSLTGGSSSHRSNNKSSGFAELDSNFNSVSNGGSKSQKMSKMENKSISISSKGGSSKTSSLNLSSSINSSYKLNNSNGGGGSCSVNSGLKSLTIESSKMDGGRSYNSKENLQKAVGLLRNYYKDNLA